MLREYNITKLNPRRNPYYKQLEKVCKLDILHILHKETHVISKNI